MRVNLEVLKMLMKCAATSSAANVQRNPAAVLT